MISREAAEWMDLPSYEDDTDAEARRLARPWSSSEGEE